MSLKLCVAEDDLEFLPPPGQCWGFQYAWPHWVSAVLKREQTKGFVYAQQALYKPSYTPAQKRITSLLLVPEQDGDLATTTGPEKDTVGPLPSALACFSGEGSLELSTTS